MMVKMEIYKDDVGEFRWRLKASNGRILAVSSEGYKRKSVMQRVFDTMVHHMCYGNFDVKDLVPTEK